MVAQSKGISVNRHLVGLAAVFVASVAIALPSSISKMTAKQAVLKGIAASSVARPEQMVSQLIIKLRSPSASELVRPMSAGRVQTLVATAGVGMKSVRAMAGNASLLALDTPLPLSEATAVAARLSTDPSIEYAEPDIMFKKTATPNETRFTEWQWNLFSPAATYTGALQAGGTKAVPATGGANLQLAWDATTGVSSVVVAIIDTGIVNHQDLNGIGGVTSTYVPNGRFLPGYDFISSNVGSGATQPVPANFVANDGNGRDADPSDPGDWVTEVEEMTYPATCDDGNTGPQNSSWHGTHMAGVAAATANNAMGIAGIAWNVRVLPVRALGKCGGSLTDIAEAIRWAAGLPVPGVPNNPTPAQVLNLSLGGGTTCGPTMQSAVDAAVANGAVIVAATGNDGSTDLIAPANCTGVIAVTAHTINGENADYANIGAMTAISAPGGGSPSVLGAGGETDDTNWFGYYIWSTILFGSTGPTSVDSGGRSGPAYSGFTGTSAATPQVAGFAALIKSVLPSATPAAIRTFITSNARAFPTGTACASGGQFVGNCGAGLLDTTIAPTVLSAPANVNVLAGQTATFSVGASGLRPLTFQWQRNGTAIGGATSSSYTTPALAVTDSGASYSVAITNPVTTSVSSAAIVTVTPNPTPAPPSGGAPPPTGGGGGGSIPMWQVLLLAGLMAGTRFRVQGIRKSLRPVDGNQTARQCHFRMASSAVRLLADRCVSRHRNVFT